MEYYYTKVLKKDFENKIVPQHWDDAADDFDVRKGRNGAGFIELVNSAGTPFNTSDGKLPVKGAVSLDLTTDGVTNRVVAKISQTAGENVLKDADAGAKVDSATLPAGGSGKIGWLSAIWAKLGAVVLAASDVIIGRVKLTNGTNVAGVDADGSVLTKLTGSNLQENPQNTVAGLQAISCVETMWVRLGREGVQVNGYKQNQAISDAGYSTDAVVLVPAIGRRLYPTRLTVSTNVDSDVAVKLKGYKQGRTAAPAVDSMPSTWYETFFLAANHPHTIYFQGDVWLEEGQTLAVTAKGAAAGLLNISASGWEVAVNV